MISVFGNKNPSDEDQALTLLLAMLEQGVEPYLEDFPSKINVCIL